MNSWISHDLGCPDENGLAGRTQEPATHDDFRCVFPHLPRAAAPSGSLSEGVAGCMHKAEQSHAPSLAANLVVRRGRNLGFLSLVCYF